MHIKQVVIEGFKSYKEQIATETFSPRHNCVVGANGSGKTNFFYAIRFVLGDLFGNLRVEDRQALLHEGAGHQVMSAFVEIVFDNSDNRIPVDRDEVRLRRTISLKKDDYFLDKKHIDKKEVINLLESAGFSRSNPYYVVQQGKIASLTTMKDAERLELLKEIGGTNVYEEKRKQSLEVMANAEQRNRQIAEFVETIEARLKELDEEKEELQKYQKLDKQRRSLEYTILDKEVADVRAKLEEVEEARAEVASRSSTVHDKIQEAKDELKDMEKEVKAAAKAAQTTAQEKEIAEQERNEAIQKGAKLELDVKDMEQRLANDVKAKEDVSRELANLEKDLEAARGELEQVKPKHEEWNAKEEAIAKEIGDTERQLSTLFAKQSRTQQYTSRAERDKAVHKQIDGLAKTLAQKTKQISTLEEEIAQAKSSLDREALEVSQCEERIRKSEELVTGCNEECTRLKGQRDALQNERNALWRRDGDLLGEVKKLRESIGKAEKHLDNAASRDISRGIVAVRRLVKEHNVPGVYGSLLELVDCEDRFNVAIEVTAGNRLFHIVVENDEIGTQLARYLVQQKAGRVTFIPLNRLRPPRVNYPSGNDVIPLLNKLKFDGKFTNAFAEVFAKTLVCRDLDVASKVARDSDLNCVTLEGDQVNKKGAMTGGFQDVRKSKLSSMKVIKRCGTELAEKDEEQRSIKASLQDVDQKISSLLAEMQKQEAKRQHLKDNMETLKQELKAAKQLEHSNRKALIAKEKSLDTARTTVGQLQEQIGSLEAELKSELTGQLTPKEKAQIADLQAKLPGLQDSLLECKNQRMEIETRRSELEALLATNLGRRQEELEQQLGAIDVDSRTEDLRTRREELKAAQNAIKEASKRQKELVQRIEAAEEKARKAKAKQEDIKDRIKDLERSIQDESKDMDELLGRRARLHAKRDDLQRKLRDLGVVPSDAFQKYDRMELKDLHKKLQRVNKDLKKFSHVNKKALDQYVNFTEQREDLRKRQESMRESDEKIRELIDVLDKRKDEAIERTFKQVAKNFQTVFSELVQGGRGSLVMMKKRRAEEMEGEDEEDEPEGGESSGRVDKYIGVKVKVSFGTGETQSLKQLSGGQKTVVALSLIFAIQRCDPAPFYLFDEIDAALDPQYRTAVGNMIKRQADADPPTQFITTTFRPELVKVADQIYGVTHKNRVSRVDVVAKQDALRFIEQDQSHNHP